MDRRLNRTYCAETISWRTPGGSTQPVCVTDDGRVLNGRVASTRVRLNFKPYTPEAGCRWRGESAWVVMAAEETKALGDMLVDPMEIQPKIPSISAKMSGSIPSICSIIQ